jgi:hypothetical protein
MNITVFMMQSKDNAKFPETMANETYQDLLKQSKAVVETYGLKDNGWRR